MQGCRPHGRGYRPEEEVTRGVPAMAWRRFNHGGEEEDDWHGWWWFGKARVQPWRRVCTVGESGREGDDNHGGGEIMMMMGGLALAGDRGGDGAHGWRWRVARW